MQVVEGESFSAALYPNNCLDLMQHFCSQVSLDVGDDFWASSRNHVIQISPSGLWLCLHESRIIYFYVICSSLMLLNCGVGEDSWESLGLQGRRSNQSILKEISPEYSSEGLMLKLKCQYLSHLMGRDDPLEKDSDAGKDWGQDEKKVTEDEMVGWYQ